MILLYDNVNRGEVMHVTPKLRLILELSDRILTLLENADEMPRSDVQGVAEAIVMSAVAWGQKNPTER